MKNKCWDIIGWSHGGGGGGGRIGMGRCGIGLEMTVRSLNLSYIGHTAVCN